jgi:DNA-binding NarL/FixJ family response regulator
MADPVKVMIVDDHRVFAEALALALANDQDLSVVGSPVTNGDDAADAVLEHGVDVVLMDLNLPGKDGIEATRDIKKVHPETKVVVLTAEDGERRLADAAVAGASGYLTKARAVVEVVDAVKRAAAGEMLIPGDILARILTEVAGERTKKAEADRMAETITPRELEVLQLLANGLSSRGIANKLVVSPRTIDTHVHNLLAKLGVHSKLEAVVNGLRWGLVHIEPGKE